MSIAKNYLKENEIKALNLIVSAYLDFAELQALNRKPMYMADWISKLDDFLRLSDRDILTHAGKISHDDAVIKAEAEFERFRQTQAALLQPVDEHFEQSLDELKKIEKRKETPQERAKKLVGWIKQEMVREEMQPKPAKKKSMKKKPKPPRTE